MADDARAEPRPETLREGGMLAIAEDGFVSGVLGGSTVAIFFFVVDLLRGQPFYTPSLLGSILLQGADPSSVVPISAPMVVAYTAVHMALFILAGMAAAAAVRQFETHPHLGVVLLLLFICFEAGFLGFALAFAPGVVPTIGGWLIAVANLLSAAVMAWYLLVLRHPHAFRNLDRVWKDETPGPGTPRF